MYAASGIIIRNSPVRKPGTVGVSRDQDLLVFFAPMTETALGFVLSGIIFGCTGGIQKTKMLQGCPEITDQKPGQLPKRRIPKVCLVPMGQVKLALTDTVTKNQTGIILDIRKKRLGALGGGTEVIFAGLLTVASFFLDHIMVSVQKIKPSGCVEIG